MKNWPLLMSLFAAICLCVLSFFAGEASATEPETLAVQAAQQVEETQEETNEVVNLHTASEEVETVIDVIDQYCLEDDSFVLCN